MAFRVTVPSKHFTLLYEVVGVAPRRLEPQDTLGCYQNRSLVQPRGLGQGHELGWGDRRPSRRARRATLETSCDRDPRVGHCGSLHRTHERRCDGVGAVKGQ